VNLKIKMTTTIKWGRVLPTGESYRLDQHAMRKLCSWIVNRHQIYQRRFIDRLPPPWTNDKVLLEWKFCNVFRELDPGSRFVIEELIPKLQQKNNVTAADYILNMLVYRTFNRIDSFRALITGLGDVLDCNGTAKSEFAISANNTNSSSSKNSSSKKSSGRSSSSSSRGKGCATGNTKPPAYSNKKCEMILRKWLKEDKQRKLWTGAFVVSAYHFGIYRSNKDMFPDKLSRVAHLIPCWAKLILALSNELNELIQANTPPKVVSRALYDGLKECPGVGAFNAYQVAVDIGYWNKDFFNEDVFTIAGPGAKNGVELCFERYTFPSKVTLNVTASSGMKKTWIRDKKVTEQKKKEMKISKKRKRKISSPPYERMIEILVDEVNNHLLSHLNGITPNELFYDRPIGRRQLNLMSMENCMCELSKYARVGGRNGRVRYPGNNISKNEGITNKKSKYQHTSNFLPATESSKEVDTVKEEIETD
jgi:hypothetical protein